MPPGGTERSLRLRVNDRRTVLDDAVQGRFEQRLRSQVGDFVIRRADGIVAYHLATVVDDARAGVTHVIRGADLLDSTPRQIALQRALGLATPRYAHLPVVVDVHGHKLSKQSGALDTRTTPAAALWCTALDLLGHPPPAPLRDAPAARLRDWALATWSLRRVPRTPAQAPVQAPARGDPAGAAAAVR
jgi:glutamyl-Q tRNA(Asp) synthetase